MTSTLVRHQMGRALNLARTQAGLTMQEVAIRALTCKSYVSEIEKGRKEVSSEKLDDLCQALNISVPGLLELVAREIRYASEH